jgi:hypothetical protein
MYKRAVCMCREVAKIDTGIHRICGKVSDKPQPVLNWKGAHPQASSIPPPDVALLHHSAPREPFWMVRILLAFGDPIDTDVPTAPALEHPAPQ